MNASSVVQGLAGVRGCVVGDDVGHVAERVGIDMENPGSILVGATKLNNAIGALGSILGLGTVDVVTTKGAQAAWVAASDSGASIAVRLDPGSATTAVEAALKNTNWFALIEWDVRDSELECVPVAAPKRPDNDDRQTRPAPGPDLSTGPNQPTAAPPSAAAHAPGRPTAPALGERGAQSAVKWRVAPSRISTAIRAARNPGDITSPESVERSGREKAPAPPAAEEFESSEVTKSAARALPAAPAFVGRLQTLCLPDLLEFLRNGQRTGTMLISSGAGKGRIYVRAGRLLGASAPATKPLPGYLVASGAVPKERLLSLRHISQDAWSKPTIGGVLVASGVVTMAQVRMALGEQIRDAVAELLSWSDGDFSFDSESAPALAAVDRDLEFDAQGILLELLKNQDEAAQASK